MFCIIGYKFSGLIDMKNTAGNNFLLLVNGGGEVARKDAKAQREETKAMERRFSRFSGFTQIGRHYVSVIRWGNMFAK